jgi:ribose 1,5-bisphosphokinase
MRTSGTFFGICGPSGAGKDTVLRLACAILGPRDDIILARRVITRATGAGEDNESVSVEDFEQRRAAGAFLLHWQAHGLSYGLPITLLGSLKAGYSVIANLSRGALAEARALSVPTVLIEISASPDILAARLAQRGREEHQDRQARLARNALYGDGITTDHLILNDGTPESAAEHLAAIIRDTLATNGIQEVGI